MWKIIDEGKTIGTKGSEGGKILLDFEHDYGMRITLEECPNYFAITYGIYGNMVDTLFGKEEEMRLTVECLKLELEYYKYVPDTEDLEEICDFCSNMYERRKNSVPVPFDSSKEGFNDLRSFSLNYFMIDMFPEIKEEFIKYTGKDSYFYGAFCTYPDLLKPLVIKAIDETNESILDRFSNLLEDISYSPDEYIDNFFHVGILEDIYFLENNKRELLLKYLKENTLKKYKEYAFELSKMQK